MEEGGRQLERSAVVDMEALGKLMSMSREEEEREWAKRCIYRVPRYMKERNSEAYSPQVVSIGPYHHGKPHLRPMEMAKHRALAQRLRRRYNNMRRSLEDYVNALIPVAEQLMDAYDELGEEWRSDRRRFLELMVLDGCFLVEIQPTLERYMGGGTSSTSTHVNTAAGAGAGGSSASDQEYCYYHSDKDSIFGLHVTLPFDIRDLLKDLTMLENQLPLLVLKRIEGLPADDQYHDQTNQQLNYNMGNNTREVDDLHLLDNLRKDFIGRHREALLPYRHHHQKHPTFYCASELHKAGILFKSKQTTGQSLDVFSSCTDITFDGRGVLFLPPIPLFHHVATEMLNLVAFERLHSAVGHEVAAYIEFIAGLIRSPDDVELLKSQRIISTDQPNDKKVVEFIQKLHRDMNYFPESCYERERAAIDVYYKSNMNKWKRKFRDWGGNLQETYFKNPWTIISLFAGIILLGLTMAQTIYAAIPVYRAD